MYSRLTMLDNNENVIEAQNQNQKRVNIKLVLSIAKEFNTIYNISV